MAENVEPRRRLDRHPRIAASPMTPAWDHALNIALVFGLVVGAVAYAWAQYQSQRARGKSDALDTALGEIEALKTKTRRQQDDLDLMRQDMTKLQVENDTFRKLIADALRTTQ